MTRNSTGSEPLLAKAVVHSRCHMHSLSRPKTYDPVVELERGRTLENEEVLPGLGVVVLHLSSTPPCQCEMEHLTWAN